MKIRNIKYPHYRNELLRLVNQDQKEIKLHSRNYDFEPDSKESKASLESLIANSRKRSKRMLEIIDETHLPTVENIGLDGSQAVSVIALHSNLITMEKVLKLFETAYKIDPGSIYNGSIPSLIDRILILKHKKQVFGTQWILGKDNRFFMPQVEDFSSMNKNRLIYGLSKSRYPVSLSHKESNQVARPFTRKSDQRPLTDDEYKEYSYGYID